MSEHHAAGLPCKRRRKIAAGAPRITEDQNPKNLKANIFSTATSCKKYDKMTRILTETPSKKLLLWPVSMQVSHQNAYSALHIPENYSVVGSMVHAQFRLGDCRRRPFLY